MWIITLILTIAYIIWLSNLISLGVATATRIALATEATALSIASIYAALSPEARERADEFQRQIKDAKLIKAQVIEAGGRRAWILLALLAGLSLLALAFGGLAHAESQTTFRDASGRTTGTAAIDSQGTTTFRDASGRTTGTATFSNQGSAGGTTTFRDAGGRTTGTASTPWRSR